MNQESVKLLPSSKLSLIKSVAGTLLILGALPLFAFTLFGELNFTDLLQLGSMQQVAFLLFSAGFYLIKIRNSSGFPGIGKGIVGVGIFLSILFLYFNFIPGVPKMISQFPAEDLISPSQNDHYQIIPEEGYNNRLAAGELGFKDLSSGNIYNVSNKSASAALGEDFAVWVAEAGDPKAKKEDDGTALEFDIWKYDFKTKQASLLLERLDNNFNPNATGPVILGRLVAFPTFKNKLIIINVDTKKIEEVPMVDGYGMDMGGLSIGNKIIISAYLSKTYHTTTLFSYDVVTKNFEKIYEISKNSRYHISELRSSKDGKLYWREYADWAPDKYFVVHF